MVYLTGKETQRKKPENSSSNDIKRLKLQQLLRKHKKQKQKTIKQALLFWRRVINLDHLALRK
jgi:hypothetical protein